MTSLARPPALRPGDRVAVLSASSPVPQEQLEVGLGRLRAAGLEPVVHESARDQGSLRPYLAGDDALRVADLTSALADPSIAGVLAGRGGSGAGRTVGLVDWAALRDVTPKVVAGYSDVTAVHEAVASRLGWASVHGANVTVDAEFADFSAGTLLDVLFGRMDPVVRFPASRALVGGRAQGVTLGGNLCLLEASLATPTSRPAAGGILLLEEESEDVYRLDRMISHLLRAGYLDGVAGVVCGRWNGCEPAEIVEPMLLERLGPLGVPVLVGADIGHGGPNRAFPLGIAAELDADAGTVTYLDPPVLTSR